LLIVAAIVFTAVQWSELGAAVQALALVVVTLSAGWVTRWLRRRGLTATAEAASVVVMALLPVDVHALREVAQALDWGAGPGGDPLVYWCLSIWGMAAVAWWFGRFSGTVAPRIVATTAAQVPVPLYVVDRPVEAPWAELLCLLQAALVLVAVRRASGAVLGARIAAAVGAVGTWLAVTPATVAVALQLDGAERVAGAGVVAAGAGVAGLAAALWPDQRVVRTLGTAVGTLAGLVAAGLAVSAGVTGFAWCAVAAGISGAVLLAALRLPRVWGDPPALVAAVAGAVTSLPVGLVAAAAVTAAFAALDLAWAHEAGTSVRALAEPAYDLPGAGLAVAHLVTLALVAVGALPRVGRRVVLALLLGVGGLAALVVPVAVDLPVAAAMTIALAAAAVPVVTLAERHPAGGAVPAGTFAGLAGLALLWAAASPGTTLVALGVVTALACGLTAAAIRDGAAAVAYAGAVVTVVAAVAGAGLAVAASGGAATTAWIVAGVTAAGATLVAGALGAGLRGSAGDRAAATLVVAQGTGIALHLLSLLRLAGTGDARDVAVLVAATTVLAAWYTNRGIRDGDPAVASLGAAVLAVAAGAEAGLVAAALGATATTVALATGLTGAAGALAFTLVDWRGDWTGARGEAATAGASLAVVVHAGALAALLAQGTAARELAILVAASVAVAGWWTFRAVRVEATGIASVAGGALACAAGIEAGLVTATLGAADARAVLASGLTAALATVAFAALDWRGTRTGARRDAALAGEAASAAVHAGALVVLVAVGGGARDVAVLLAATIGLTAWWAYGGVRDGNRALAATAAAVLALAVGAEAALVAAAAGADGDTVALAVGVTAAAVTLAFAVVDRRGLRDDARGAVARAGEAAAAAVHVGAIVALVGGPYPLDSAGAASVVLATGAAVAAVQALRPGRRPVAAWAVVEAVVLIWLRLAVAGVGVAEAYTLPVAAAFLAAAVIARRTGLATRYPSWVVDGPWLVMAVTPTVALALADGGLVRSLAGLVAGTVALVAGAASRRRAPVDVGVAVVVLLGVRQLAPVVGSLPNWATLGACGLVLLVAGATFEERRRDLRAIRDRYANLV
jgi:hypothetical protein